MEGELQLQRFFSCRGVSFEISRNDSSNPPPASTNTNEEAQDENPVELLVSSPTHIFSGTESRASSHFCDIDIEDDEEYEYPPPSCACQPHDIEDLLLLSINSSHVLFTSGSLVHSVEETRHHNEEYQLPLPLPKKASKAKTQESRLSVILLDQGLLTVYKRLFALCLALNLLGLVVAATGHFPYAKDKAALFSIGNILASVLCRNEAFLRCVFWVAVKLLGSWSWVPLAVKCTATSFLQGLGGIHSGCGVSSMLWLIYSLVQTLSHRESSSDEIIGVASAILGLLFISSLAAFPLVRHLHHNLFERFHRFAGWAALVMLWTFVILTTSYNPLDKSYNVRGSSLVEKQEFWFTVAITLIIVFPWVCVRRVPVKVYAPSNDASLIKFQGGIKSGMMGRISRSPFSEWHTFGIISDGKEEHMMLAGAVGDFTRELVSDPPTHLWVAKGIEQNFGDEIVRMVKNYPSEKMIIHDTSVWGRPNVREMTVKAVRRWGGEVVIVTSNPSGSRDVVKGCKAVGIPAFGPIWDS